MPTNSALINDPNLAEQAAEQYSTNATGPLTTLTAALGWEKLPEKYRNTLSPSALADLSQLPADWPELEIAVVPSFAGYNEDFATADPTDGYNYGTIISILAAPFSRGNVTISSNSMVDLPVINPAWLSNTTDVELMIAAVKRMREIWNAMRNVTIGDEYFPGTTDVSSDQQILDYIGKALMTVWHASATCAMGKVEDPMAVVDNEARVFGVQGLRVVDASIFPLLPPGHPQSTVYALALKIADNILSQAS